jgi:hypothetical protein
MDKWEKQREATDKNFEYKTWKWRTLVGKQFYFCREKVKPMNGWKTKLILGIIDGNCVRALQRNVYESNLDYH